jgi:hypothetical protein
MTEKDLLKKWNRLYNEVYSPIHIKYDAINKIFTSWNNREIDTATAIRKLTVFRTKKNLRGIK